MAAKTKMENCTQAIEILLAWGMGRSDAERLLHCHPTNVFHLFVFDMRALSIIGIRDMLPRLFENQENIRSFMRMANQNAPFNGLSPLEAMRSGALSPEMVCNHIKKIGSLW